MPAGAWWCPALPPPRRAANRSHPLVRASASPSSRSPLFESEVFQKEMDGLAQEM